ncbi:MAG: hypothetical protein VKJ06_03385 [Vampirovibrionales bacterium]|nr:hypothetical protein [Vampirovibrionales bacterium]
MANILINTNRGPNYTVRGTAASDTVTINPGTYTGLSHQDTIVGSVLLGQGNNTLRVNKLDIYGDPFLSAEAITGNVTAGSGNDTLLIKGRTNHINAGAGANRVYVYEGAQTGNITTGSGKDSVVIGAEFSPYIDSNYTSTGNISLGAGDDVANVRITARGFTPFFPGSEAFALPRTGVIDGGSGRDVFVLSGVPEGSTGFKVINVDATTKKIQMLTAVGEQKEITLKNFEAVRFRP